MSLAGGLAASSETDIILLDWDLPGVSGIELLVELRQCGVNVPVVFLTGYDFTAYENLAFETGAVDFIDKARGVEILARRLRRVLKARKPAGAPAAASLIVCGKLVLNPNVSRAYWNERDVGLTLVEYNIVHLLTSKAGRWVTYRAIYDRVHYEGFIGGSGRDGFRINVRGIIGAYARSSSFAMKHSSKSKTLWAWATVGRSRLALAERGAPAVATKRASLCKRCMPDLLGPYRRRRSRASGVISIG